MEEGLVWMPYIAVAKNVSLSDAEFIPSKKLKSRYSSGYISGKIFGKLKEILKPIDIEDIQWMEPDEFNDGYWFYKYTGKILTDEEVKRLNK